MFKISIPLFLYFFLAAQTAAGQSNIHYYQDTGRQPDEIERQYPYDIPLRTADNDTLNSAGVFEKNGRPVILLFWLTTCAPCRMEMAAISKKYESWKKETDFNFYAISIDWPRNAVAFNQVVRKNNWPFPAWHDFDREFGKIMPGNLNGLPQVFVLDKNGQIVRHKRKYRPGDEDVLLKWVKELNGQ